MQPSKTAYRDAERKRSAKTPGSHGGSEARNGPKRAGPGPGSVEAILDVIRAIPRGKTAGYGQVAALAGNPRGARQVARVLHSLSEKRALPWHRVINRSGCISLPMEGPGARQAALLRAEGVAVSAAGKVAPSAAWQPGETRKPEARTPEAKGRPAKGRPEKDRSRRSRVRSR
jgi:methylated-DNA-protein-cysteine methyltransferase-like protein